MGRFRVETLVHKSSFLIRSHPEFFSLSNVWENKEEKAPPPPSCWRIHATTAVLHFDLRIKDAFIFGVITILTLLKDTESNPIL